MKMDLKYLQKLMKMLDSSNLAELEIEEEGTKIKLSKPRPKVASMTTPMQMQAYQPMAMPSQSQNGSDVEVSKTENSSSAPANSENLVEVKSPMVGTFYRAPSPGAESYVQVGSSVSEGSVLCIIEAMKLMNEIESDVTGKVVKILVENEQAVEYGQPLFLIERN